MNSLMLVKLDVNYCNYLRRFDSRVPYNFKEKELRPFVGVLFEVADCMYFAPLSSPKPKHLKLKSKIDFMKIDGGKLGAINFNNMLPVKENNIIKIDLNVECLKNSEKNYINLLRQQIYWLNRNNAKLFSKSKKLYCNYLDGKLDDKISARCCNFKLLEEKCLEYNK